MTTFTSSRLLPAGLAGALTIITVNVGDAASGSPSSLTTIVPCRLVDTRPDLQVGSRGEPIPANTSVTFAVRGSNGECTIPNNATGIASNVTIVNPTAASFLTVYPADAATRPNASNLNWFPGSPPTPNQVTVGLSANGAINVYNLAGTVDVIIDIVGYYTTTPAPPSTTSPPTTVKPLPRLIQEVEPKALMYGCGGCPVDIAQTSLPKGHWLVSYTVTVVNNTDTPDLFRCWLTTFVPGPIVGMTTSRVGLDDVSPLHGESAMTINSDQGELIKIQCSHDVEIGPATPIQEAYLENATLSAVEVAA